MPGIVSDLESKGKKNNPNIKLTLRTPNNVNQDLLNWMKDARLYLFLVNKFHLLWRNQMEGTHMIHQIWQLCGIVWRRKRLIGLFMWLIQDRYYEMPNESKSHHMDFMSNQIFDVYIWYQILYTRHHSGFLTHSMSHKVSLQMKI